MRFLSSHPTALEVESQRVMKMYAEKRLKSEFIQEFMSKGGKDIQAVIVKIGLLGRPLIIICPMWYMLLR